MTVVKDVIADLRVNYKPYDVIAVAIWTVDDVKARAKERGIDITDEEAELIISAIDREQSAELGISWDTIDAFLDIRLPEHRSGEERL